MAVGFSRIFTLEADGRPTLAFEASSTAEARKLCKESWLIDDLISLKSDGVVLGSANSKLHVRPASPEEAPRFSREFKTEMPTDDVVLVFLVTLDQHQG